MKQYLDLLRKVYDEGTIRGDRTGTGTRSIFGHQMRFDLNESFPLLTTKKVHLRAIIHELLWFLRGDTNIKYLQDNNVTIWDEWADAKGNLGPVYGSQWRSWATYQVLNYDEVVDHDDKAKTFFNAKVRYTPIDQIKNVVESIRNNPESRRHIVTAWNPAKVDEMALPPCHVLFQFYVANGKLSCQLYQRSADTFLGVPFNIASYAMLTMMIAQQTDLEPGEFIWTGGDCHLYQNHLTQAELQLSRMPMEVKPQLIIKKAPSIFDYKFEDFTLINYVSHAAIPAPIAV